MNTEDEEEEKEDDKDLKAASTYQNERNRWTKIYVIYYIIFLMNSAWTVTYTSMWPYITSIDPNRNPTFLGLVNCVRGVSSLVASVLFGYWYDYRGANEPLIISNVLFLVGHLLYIFPRDVWVILIARFLIGFSSGAMAVCRTLAAQLCDEDELVKVMSTINLVEVIAFFFGPISQLVTTLTSKSKSMEILRKYHFNMYTIPVWVLILFGVISVLLQAKYFFFENKKPLPLEQKVKNKTKYRKKIEIDKWAVGLILFIYFTIQTLPTTFETIIIPALMDVYALTKRNAIVISCIVVICYAAINIASYALMPVVSTRISDRALLLFGIIAVTVGTTLSLPFGPGKMKIKHPISQLTNNTELSGVSILGCPYEYDWCHYIPQLPVAQFLVALVITAIGEPPSFTGTSVLYIKAIGSENQGSYLGWYSGIESISRIVGPLYGSLMYWKLGIRGVFGGLLFFLLLNLVFYLISWRRVIPCDEQVLNYEKLNQEIDNDDK